MAQFTARTRFSSKREQSLVNGESFIFSFRFVMKIRCVLFSQQNIEIDVNKA